MALTALQVAAAAYIGGFTGNTVVQAVQVAYAESSWNPSASNSCCYGLWQINKGAHADLFKKYKWDNPADNARMANIIFQKEASLLHPEGQWCSHGKPPNGCNPWQGYGNANYNSKKNEAEMAYAQLKKALQSGKSAEDVLGTKGSANNRSVEGTVNDAVGAVTSPITAVADMFNRAGSWITNPDNLMRIFKVVAGGAVVLIGAAAMMDKEIGSVAMNVVPAGKIAKVLKK